MISYRTGNIILDDSEAIVNTVNCVGVMGKGLALQFKKAFSDNFKKYKSACDRKEVKIGEMFITEQGDMLIEKLLSTSLLKITGKVNQSTSISSLD